MNFAVIFAGGVGKRMNTTGTPKQFLKIFNKPIIVYTIEKFQECASIDYICVVVLADYIQTMKEIVDYYRLSKVKKIVQGGQTGQESIFNGLKAIKKDAKNDDIVLIHDGVRPVIDNDLIERSIAGVKNFNSAIACSPAVETIINIKKNKSESSISVIPRNECVLAKAPQCFLFGDIYQAHIKAKNDNYVDAIDSASLMNHFGFNLNFIKCSSDNIKITYPVDVYLFKGILEASENSSVFGL